jgi:uncharacterized protein YbjQ (UPF0145 family)
MEAGSEFLTRAAELRTRITNSGAERMSGPLSELLKEFDRGSIDENTAAWLNYAFTTVGLKCSPAPTAEMSLNKRLVLVPVAPAVDREAVADILVSTTFEIPGYVVVDFRGEVFGLVVRARNALSNVGASLKSIVGAELGGLTRLLESGRADAVSRMRNEARARGANAVVGLRYDSSELADWGNEVVAYGTAVVVRKADDA